MASSDDTLVQTINLLSKQLLERTDELKAANAKIEELEFCIHGIRVVKGPSEITETSHKTSGSIMEYTGDSYFHNISELKKVELSLFDRFHNKLSDKGISRDIITNLLNISGVYAFGSFVTEVLLDKNMNVDPFISIVALHGKCKEITEYLDKHHVKASAVYKEVACSAWNYDVYGNIRLYYPENGTATLQDAQELCKLTFLTNFYYCIWFTVSNHISLLKKVHHTVHHTIEDHCYLGIYKSFGFNAICNHDPDYSEYIDDREKIAY